MTKLRVLGCSGGIGSGFQTSCYLLNERVLIDAGTGLTQLTLYEMGKIDHVVITHAHLDHIACLPLLLDTTITHRKIPVTVWGSEETIAVLRDHIFNNTVWPDFTAIPNKQRPFMRYAVLKPYQPVQLERVKITPVPVPHTVPTFSYLLTSATSGQQFMLCGDTTVNDELWDYMNGLEKVKGIAIEVAFRAKEEWLALLAKHLSSNLLLQELEKLKDDQVEVYVMHLKPVQFEQICQELAQYQGRFKIHVLSYNQMIEF